jgi:(S)-sulfolactate dehydrogenase
MQVVAHTHTPPAAMPEGLEDVPLLPLAEVLARSDVLSIHLPLTEATRGLVGAQALAAMKRGAVLVNTARGAIVDGAALVDALRSGHLRGAALDVFDPEPLPAGSVFAERPPNLLLSPHVGSTTAQSEHRVGDLVATRLLDHLAAHTHGAAPTPA